MGSDKKLRKEAATNKEYNIATGRYDNWPLTCWIDRKPFRNWKLYRKTQHKDR